MAHDRGRLQQCTSVAEKSDLTSEARGRSREDPMPKVWQPRGATPRPRSGVAAESARLQQHRSSQEDLHHVQGAVAAPAQEGLEELLHVQGQEGRG